jgi:hypothetical protein
MFGPVSSFEIRILRRPSRDRDRWDSWNNDKLETALRSPSFFVFVRGFWIPVKRPYVQLSSPDRQKG